MRHTAWSVFVATLSPADISSRNRRGSIQMSKMLFGISVAALIVACVAGWATSQSKARVAPAETVQLDPLKMMTGAKQMPSEHFADYSFVFN